MGRAKPGDEITLVIAFNPDGERYGVFSTPEAASAWMDVQLGHCVCVDTMVVDVPEFGNITPADAA